MGRVLVLILTATACSSARNPNPVPVLVNVEDWGISGLSRVGIRIGVKPGWQWLWLAEGCSRSDVLLTGSEDRVLGGRLCLEGGEVLLLDRRGVTNYDVVCRRLVVLRDGVLCISPGLGTHPTLLVRELTSGSSAKLLAPPMYYDSTVSPTRRRVLLRDEARREGLVIAHVADSIRIHRVTGLHLTWRQDPLRDCDMLEAELVREAWTTNSTVAGAEGYVRLIDDEVDRAGCQDVD